MNKPFNRLTDAEAERLALLAEEAGEIVQAVGKVLRHGYESYNPTVPEGEQISNRLHLAIEIGHLVAVAGHMADLKDINGEEVELSADQKMEKARRYMHHYEEFDPNKKGVWE